jgi:hypothetical protein
VFWWPHGGHGERARARAGYGARRWAHGRPGRASAERFAALQRHQEALSLRSLFGGCSGTRTVETWVPVPGKHLGPQGMRLSRTTLYSPSRTV